MIRTLSGCSDDTEVRVEDGGRSLLSGVTALLRGLADKKLLEL
jgi:hypothetical protein